MKRMKKLCTVVAIALVAAVFGSAVPTVSYAVDKTTSGENSSNGVRIENVEITGENEALSGWQYYFYNSTLYTYYHSNDLFVRATEDGRTGNALEIERKKAEDELWVYSYSFEAEPSATYEISSFVKIADATGRLVYCVKEIDENGKDVTDSATGAVTQYVDRHSVIGPLSDWTETSFTRTTEAATRKIVLRIRAEGIGIMNIDDLSVNKVIAPNTISYRMMSIGNDGASEKPATYNEVTESNLYNDSSDGDGKSLLLKDHDVFMPSFGMLPHGANYRLTFKYKRLSNNSTDKLSIYMDNMNPSVVRAWYADAVSGGSTTEWTSYSYDFNATSGQTDITYLRMASYGSYLIDELQISTLNEYLLNGSFEKSKYFGKFTANSTALTGANISADSSDGDGKSLELVAGTNYLLYYSMILPKNAKYNLSFKYKKLEEAATNITVKCDGYHGTETSTQFWFPGDATQGKVGEWVDYSLDFYSLGEGTSDIQYVMFTANGGNFLVDEVSVKRIDSFTDVQYIGGGNFGGAYLNGYEFGGTSNFNFAKQADGTFAFASMHTTYNVGVGARGYFRVNTGMLEKGKDYTLSFDYYATGVGTEVVGVYNGNASSSEKRIVSINSPVTEWTKHEVTFTAGKYDQNFLEVYGTAYGRNTTFIRNIQITDANGKTYIANQSLVAPSGSGLAYSSDFGTGSAQYAWSDWEIANGGIYGITFEDGNKDYKICLNGTADKEAVAISKEINVAGMNVVKIDQKIYYTADASFGSNLVVTVLAGDKEITANENGYFLLPKATDTIRIKFAANEFVTFKKVNVQMQEQAAPDVKMLHDGVSVRTNEPYGLRWTAGVKTEDWNSLVELYGEDCVKAGVIVAPADYVNGVSEFTISALKAASLKYEDIVTDTFNKNASNLVEGYSGFYASLVNIKEGNLNRKFAARAYVSVEKDGEITYYYGEYSAENHARSIYEVCKSVVANEEENEDVKDFAKSVLNKVVEVAVENGNATLTPISGYSSPYDISLNGNVLTVTVSEGASANIADVKIVCVNGTNYKAAVSGNTVTVSIN